MSTAKPSSVLYYPYINVPQSPWFTQVLLYWDRVGAIVPYEYIQEPDKLGPYMVGLVREHLVEQVIPGMYLWQIKNFEKAFLDHVDAQKLRANYQPTWPKIHMEKLQGLGDALSQRGLARKHGKEEYSPWYKVEPKVADSFMAYLASALGQLAEERFYPITQDSESLSMFIDKSIRSRFATRKIVLDAILPAPSGEIEAGRLAEFKAAHKEELRRFRLLVEDKISELSLIGRERDRQMRSREVSSDLRSEVDELANRMNEQHNWPRIGFADFCAVAGSGIGIWEAVRNHSLTFGLTSAALSLAPVVRNAFRGSDLHLEDRPLAYAASTKLSFK